MAADMLKAGTDAKNAVFVTWTRRLPAYCAASSAVNAREARSMRHVPGFFLKVVLAISPRSTQVHVITGT